MVKKMRLNFNWEGIFMFKIDYFMDWVFKIKRVENFFFIFIVMLGLI